MYGEDEMEGASTFEFQLEAFAEAVRGQRPTPDARPVARLADAVLVSAGVGVLPSLREDEAVAT